MNSMNQTWRVEAACKNMPTDMFYPEPGEDVSHAKKVCDTCRVRVDCLEYALKAGERHGVFGGTSERDRRRMRRKRRIEAAAVSVVRPRMMRGADRVAPKNRDTCGSEAGYGAHRYNGEVACQHCCHAHARYKSGMSARSVS